MNMSNHDRKLILREIRDRLEALSRKPKKFDQLVMGERVELARKLCHDAAAASRRDPEGLALWKSAAALFHQTIDEAYPPDFEEHWKQLEQRDVAGLEMAITFLEKDPWFFRSGYIKPDLIRMVCRLPLSASDILRLQKVVLAAVDGRDRREFRWYCHLAKVVQSESFRQELEKRTIDGDAGTKRRSRWVMEGLAGK